VDEREEKGGEREREEESFLLVERKGREREGSLLYMALEGL
jgi:hypothetical protein